MNHYSVEIRRSTYVTIQIDAQDPAEAEELAWEEIENGDYESHGHWEISDISEEVADDDTRSYGPQGENK